MTCLRRVDLYIFYVVYSAVISRDTPLAIYIPTSVIEGRSCSPHLEAYPISNTANLAKTNSSQVRPLSSSTPRLSRPTPITLPTLPSLVFISLPKSTFLFLLLLFPVE